MNNLKELQANILVLANKVKNLHWNIKGSNFYAIHKLTDKLAIEVVEFGDQVAEKIIMHGENSLGSFQEYLALTTIKELKGQQDFNERKLAQELVDDLTTLIAIVDKVERTNVVQPLLDEIYMMADKYRWMFKKIIS